MVKFCTNCGQELENKMKHCPNCGKETGKHPNIMENNTENPNINRINEKKYRIPAVIFAILFGWLGVHNFYLGYNERGTGQVVLCFLGAFIFGIGPIVSGIWGIIEGILIYKKVINTDGYGNPILG